MKIAMIGQKGIPTLFGGVERHVEEVACRLAKKKDYQVFVYARAYYTPKKIIKYKGVSIVHLPCLKTKHLDAISHVFLATWHALFKIKADVIHYHAIGPALCLWIPKIFSPKTKIVFTFHCRDYFHQKWGKIARWSLWLGEAIGCLLADEVITVSLELKKYVEKHYGRQAYFIPHGVKKERYLWPKAIKRWDLKKNNYILVVSRLIRHKGIHYLIKAYQEIATDKKLVIVGPPFHTEDYESELKELAENNPKILFLGAQKGQTLKELYSNAYLFVNPSEEEGLPLTVLEAGSFGRPLLLSNIKIHREMFGDLPFFFENKNIESLRQNLELLLKKPVQMGQRAIKTKRYSCRNYDWDKVVDKTALKYL